jgi:hypothetical protein
MAEVQEHLQLQQLGLPPGLLLPQGPRLLLRAVLRRLHQLPRPLGPPPPQRHLARLLRLPLLLGVWLLAEA